MHARLGSRPAVPILRRLRALVGAALVPLAASAGASPELDLRAGERLRVGIGDRLRVEDGDRWVRLLDLAQQHGVQPDLVQLWLTRGWENSWVATEDLQDASARGVVPVVVHYFFGDFISRERVESQRAEWLLSIERMAERLRIPGPVLVILEPEFNIAPPPGETAITAWPGFSTYLRDAATRIRARAPNARVGVCVGDFAGVPYLEGVIGPVAADLDFLGFQEMRATTVSESEQPGYLDVGASATAYARYLARAFGRPLLLGYVAVSSHGGWEDRQEAALRDVVAHERQLLEAGVFGWIYFQLLDDPEHVGYFGAAETRFGLVDSKGRPKPAIRVLQQSPATARSRASAR